MTITTPRLHHIAIFMGANQNFPVGHAPRPHYMNYGNHTALPPNLKNLNPLLTIACTHTAGIKSI